MKNTNINLKLEKNFRLNIDGGLKKFTVTLRADRLHGNTHPHFSATGSTTNMGGCLHDKILQVWPEAKIIIDLHLANADDGVPMHDAANGWYWLKGAIGIRDEYGPDESAKKCLENFCELMRVNEFQGKRLIPAISCGKTPEDQKQIFSNYLEEQRPRWRAEADAAIEWLEDQIAAQERKLLSKV